MIIMDRYGNDAMLAVSYNGVRSLCDRLVSLWVNDCSKLNGEGALNEAKNKIHITALSSYYHKSWLEFKSNGSVWFSSGIAQWRILPNHFRGRNFAHALVCVRAYVKCSSNFWAKMFDIAHAQWSHTIDKNKRSFFCPAYGREAAYCQPKMRRTGIQVINKFQALASFSWNMWNGPFA